jgi:hypothetical protein
VNNPKIGDILDFGEERYYRMVSSFIAQPHEYRVQLYDMGLDFEEVHLFDFLWLFMLRGLKQDDTKILFGDVDFSTFELFGLSDNKERLLICGDLSIDEFSYRLIADFIRKVHGFTQSKPPTYLNKHTKDYALNRERDKLKYSKAKKKEEYQSILVPIISAYVNCEESSYTYETVMELTISQLQDAISRVKKLKQYKEIMQGLYANGVDRNKINLEEVNWLV